MKLLYDFYPKIGDTTSATITYTGGTSPAYFPTDNLFSIEPAKCFKTSNINNTNIVIDLKQNIEFDTIFLNRINFYKYNVAYSVDNTNWNTIDTVDNLTIDEVSDEKYVHNITSLKTSVIGRYVMITIPSQMPLFEPEYFKIGNIMIGKSVETMNPKQGFSVKYIPSMAVTTFKSGYISSEKLGRTRRQFNGDFDKISINEMKRFKLTYKPFVLYLDYMNDNTMCYLVMNTEEFNQTIELVTAKSMNFTFEELV